MAEMCVPTCSPDSCLAFGLTNAAVSRDACPAFYQLPDFAVKRVAAKMWIVLLLFHPIWLDRLIAGRHVARNRLVFAAGFRAF